MTPASQVLAWIQAELSPVPCASDVFIYDDMDSQSGESLPIIYRPFDPNNRGHWRDRGSMYDFAFSTHGEGAHLLDLGPGDGWPSLIVAPHAGHVTGVDASPRRVQVCAENAARLAIDNASFVHVPAGLPLPFADGTFDGAMASTSLEQTPDPRAALCELYRVLRVGGRLRFAYESLSAYRNGREQAVWLWPMSQARSRLILYDRDIEAEQARQYGLTLDISAAAGREQLGRDGADLRFSDITLARLLDLRHSVIDARVCTLTHPSGRTWARWLAEIGFRPIEPAEGGFGRHSGAWYAAQRFDQLEGPSRPQEIATIDALLRPAVEVIVRMPAPLGMDPMLTAVK